MTDVDTIHSDKTIVASNVSRKGIEIGTHRRMEGVISTIVNGQQGELWTLFLILGAAGQLATVRSFAPTLLNDADDETIAQHIQRAIAQRQRLESLRSRRHESSGSSSISSSDSLISQERRAAAGNLVTMRGGAAAPALTVVPNDDSISGRGKKKVKPRATKKAQKTKYGKTSEKNDKNNKRHGGGTGGAGGGTGVAV